MVLAREEDGRLLETGLPPETELVTVGTRGRVRHIRRYSDPKYPTLCKMVAGWPKDRLKPANEKDVWDRDVCGACLRTVEAAILRSERHSSDG